MIVGEKVICSKAVHCLITHVEKTSLLFDIYKNNKKIDRREFYDSQGLNLEQVKRSIIFEFKNL